MFATGMPSVKIRLKVSGLFRSLQAPPVHAKLLAGTETAAERKGSELLNKWHT